MNPYRPTYMNDSFSLCYILYWSRSYISNCWMGRWVPLFFLFYSWLIHNLPPRWLELWSWKLKVRGDWDRTPPTCPSSSASSEPKEGVGLLSEPYSRTNSQLQDCFLSISKCHSSSIHKLLIQPISSIPKANERNLLTRWYLSGIDSGIYYRANINKSRKD